jgi:hypothetical protein
MLAFENNKDLAGNEAACVFLVHNRTTISDRYSTSSVCFRALTMHAS